MWLGKTANTAARAQGDEVTAPFMLWGLLVMISFVGVIRALKLGSAVAAALKLPRWDRDMARRVLYRGVVNAPEDALPVIQRYRQEVLYIYSIVALGALWVIGLPFLVLLAVVGGAAFFSKPLDVSEFD